MANNRIADILLRGTAGISRAAGQSAQAQTAATRTMLDSMSRLGITIGGLGDPDPEELMERRFELMGDRDENIAAMRQLADLDRWAQEKNFPDYATLDQARQDAGYPTVSEFVGAPRGARHASIWTNNELYEGASSQEINEIESLNDAFNQITKTFELDDEEMATAQRGLQEAEAAIYERMRQRAVRQPPKPRTAKELRRKLGIVPGEDGYYHQVNPKTGQLEQIGRISQPVTRVEAMSKARTLEQKAKVHEKFTYTDERGNVWVENKDGIGEIESKGVSVEKEIEMRLKFATDPMFQTTSEDGKSTTFDTEAADVAFDKALNASLNRTKKPVTVVDEIGGGGSRLNPAALEAFNKTNKRARQALLAEGIKIQRIPRENRTPEQQKRLDRIGKQLGYEEAMPNAKSQKTMRPRGQQQPRYAQWLAKMPVMMEMVKQQATGRSREEYLKSGERILRAAGAPPDIIKRVMAALDDESKRHAGSIGAAR